MDVSVAFRSSEFWLRSGYSFFFWAGRFPSFVLAKGRKPINSWLDLVGPNVPLTLL